MPGSYTVLRAEKKADKPDKGYGPMQVILLELQDPATPTPVVAEWYTKADTAIPAVGAQLVGDLTNGQYGWSFKKAKQQGGGGHGGGRDFKADPSKQAAIAMENSHGAAIQIAGLALAHGKPTAEVERVVTALADTLYARVVKAMGDAS